jgi:hypothetical protein
MRRPRAAPGSPGRRRGTAGGEEWRRVLALTFFILFLGLEIKHVIADYMLQPAWVLAGKGDLRRPGGHAHAGVHALLSGLVMLAAGAPWAVIGLLMAAEYVVHYALDFAKVHYSAGVHAGSRPRRYWALHGFDQLGHQLTYAAMIYAVLLAMGLI